MRAGLMTGHTGRAHRLFALLALGRACGALLAWAPAGVAKVLRVGTFNGKHGRYASIQQAVQKATSGDWILVAPGDYKEAGTTVAAGSHGAGAGVLVEKSGIHIRGMDRNGVVLDGAN